MLIVKVSVEKSGLPMIAAIIVVPAVTARLLTDSFAHLLLMATAIGTLCGLVGMLLAYYLDVAPGATIVLTAASVFMLTLTATSARRRLQTERARDRSVMESAGSGSFERR